MNYRRLQMIFIVTLVFSFSLEATLSRPAAVYALAGTDYGCSQNSREQSQLITEAEANEYTVRRVEFLGNATTRHNVLNRRVVVQEGEIFNRESLERGVKNLSKLKVIKPVHLNDVEVKLNREYKHIDLLFCVREQRRSR